MIALKTLQNLGFLRTTALKQQNLCGRHIFEDCCSESTVKPRTFEDDCNENTEEPVTFEDDCTETLQNLGYLRMIALKAAKPGIFEDECIENFGCRIGAQVHWRCLKSRYVF